MRVAVLTDVCSDELNRIVEHAPDDVHVTICTPKTLRDRATRTPDIVHLATVSHAAVSLIRAWQMDASVVATLEMERVRSTGRWHRQYLRTVYSQCRRLFVASIIGRDLAVEAQRRRALIHDDPPGRRPQHLFTGARHEHRRSRAADGRAGGRPLGRSLVLLQSDLR